MTGTGAVVGHQSGDRSGVSAGSPVTSVSGVPSGSSVTSVSGVPSGSAVASSDRLERELRRMVVLQRRAIALRRRARGRPVLPLHGAPSL